MEYAVLGKTGLEVSRIGFGGAEIGLEMSNQEDVSNLLNSALDAGLSLIDSASAYWKSEKLIGTAISDRRKEYVLVSKCGALNGFTRFDWSKKGIQETIENSLRQLRTDFLDVVLLHGCDRTILERGECIEALQRAQERGLTRYFGYSGDGDDAKFAIEMDIFDVFQTSVSIADQEALETTIPLANEREIGVIAKRSIANASWRHNELPENEYHQEYWRRFQDLQYSFLEKDMSEAVGIAMKFVLFVDGITTALIGTTKKGRWQQNADLLDQIEFSDNDFRAIRERWSEIAVGKNWRGQV